MVKPEKTTVAAEIEEAVPFLSLIFCADVPGISACW